MSNTGTISSSFFQNKQRNMRIGDASVNCRKDNTGSSEIT